MMFHFAAILSSRIVRMRIQTGKTAFDRRRTPDAKRGVTAHLKTAGDSLIRLSLTKPLLCIKGTSSAAYNLIIIYYNSFVNRSPKISN